MKKYFVWLIVFLLSAIGLLVIWWMNATKSPSSDSSQVRFVITRGKGASQIANDLYAVGLIKSPLAFKFYVQLTGMAKAIGAGEFEISKNLRMLDVLNKLSGGPLQLWVTIPEGLRREEVAIRVVKALEMDTKTADEFVNDFLKLTEGMEGFLFPDTYLFARTATAAQVANKMSGTFDSEFFRLHAALIDTGAAGGLDNNGIITLASIVERETKTNAERPVVAGIYFNRLSLGMALQADATVQYAVSSAKCKVQSAKCTNWWITPTLEDLEINSPYNTYKFPGLPPAPIANPGFSSIEAVVNPTKSDYLYYIHENDGTIHYAKTLSEHNANIAKYLK